MRFRARADFNASLTKQSGLDTGIARPARALRTFLSENSPCKVNVPMRLPAAP